MSARDLHSLSLVTIVYETLPVCHKMRTQTNIQDRKWLLSPICLLNGSVKDIYILYIYIYMLTADYYGLLGVIQMAWMIAYVSHRAHSAYRYAVCLWRVAEVQRDTKGGWGGRVKLEWVPLQQGEWVSVCVSVCACVCVCVCVHQWRRKKPGEKGTGALQRRGGCRRITRSTARNVHSSSHTLADSQQRDGWGGVGARVRCRQCVSMCACMCLSVCLSTCTEQCVSLTTAVVADKDLGGRTAECVENSRRSIFEMI